MKLTVRVEQRHIDEGRRGDCLRCPVALATKEATGEYCTASSFLVTAPGRIWDTPPSVKSFISDFDNGRPVQPFEFELTDE